MRYVAAYLLAALGGNSNPSGDDIKQILASVGIDADDDKLNLVIKQLDGKSVDEVMAEGLTKLASVPSGGATSAAGASTDAPAEEAKEEAKKEESEEESDDDMGFDLFG